MEQIMTYVENGNIVDNRLKLIVYNILELLPDMNELDIEVFLTKRSRFGSIFDACTGRRRIALAGTHKFDRTDDIDEIFKAKHLDVYLNNLYNVDNVELAEWIFIVLHEIGHFRISMNFNVTDMRILKSINKSYKETMINLSIVKEGEDSVQIHQYCHTMSPIEQSADIYAYTYFQYIWNNLKIRNLI